MAGMLAIAAAAGWLLGFFLCAVVTRRPPRWADAAAPWTGLGGERPALVNLGVTRGQLNGAAYPATILDLAAKGHLMITQRMPGQLWCDVPAAAPADAGLAQSERPKDAAFAKLALGDAVTVRAAPQSGELLSLVPVRDGAAAPGQPAPDLIADEPFLRVAPGSSNLLLTEQEVSAVVGRPVGATGFQLGMLGAIYRGEDLTVSLTVTRGGMGRLSYGPARQWGRALLAIGDEAWQLARDHTVVFRLGGYTGKVTVSGSAARGLAPDVPSRLAAAVAARLPASAICSSVVNQPSVSDRRAQSPLSAPAVGWATGR
jgi:hypothetical protein